MKIIVNGQEAAIKESESFEYIIENSLFTEADAYSLEIHFPIKDCVHNQEIFGVIETPNIPENTTFECLLIDDNFYKKGLLTILSSNESEVVAQFLEGMSATNFQSYLSNIHLTELNLGEYSDERAGYTHYPTLFGPDTGYGRVVVWSDIGGFRSPNDYFNPIVELYLDELIKRVITQIGYSYDISELYQISFFSHLVVLNDLPAIPGWSPEFEIYKYADAMPYWTVLEFFTELELLFGGRFVINELTKTITFKSLRNLYDSSNRVKLSPTSTYEVTVNPDEVKNYRGNLNISFPDDVKENDVQDCQWLIEVCAEESHLHEMSITEINSHLSSRQYDYLTGRINHDSVKNLYATPVLYEDIEYKGAGDVSHTVKQILYPAINQYPSMKNVGEKKELRIIPATFTCLKGIIVQHGDGIGIYTTTRNPQIKGSKVNRIDPIDFNPTAPYDVLQEGEYEEKDKHPENIWLTIDDLTGSAPFSEANTYCKRFEEIRRMYVIGSGADEEQYPFTVMIQENSQSLSLLDPQIVNNNKIPMIDNSRKYVFNFLMDGVPDVTSEFIIRGERYVCAKITANITTSGISQLKKGEFYKVVS